MIVAALDCDGDEFKKENKVEVARAKFRSKASTFETNANDLRMVNDE